MSSADTHEHHIRVAADPVVRSAPRRRHHGPGRARRHEGRAGQARPLRVPRGSDRMDLLKTVLQVPRRSSWRWCRWRADRLRSMQHRHAWPAFAVGRHDDYGEQISD